MGGFFYLFYYLNLSKHLGSHQPMYGMQLTDSGRQLPLDLKNMAAYFVDKIRSVQHTGPYQLLGHSFGGHLVFEMARQLVAAGEIVSFLGMLDTHFPIPKPMPPLAERLDGHMRNLKILPVAKWPRYFFERERDRFIGMARHPLIQTLEKRLKLVSTNIHNRNRFASRGYKHGYYPGKISMFRVFRTDFNSPHPNTSGWEKVAAEVVYYDIPGDHHSVLNEPYVTELAKLVKKELEQAHKIEK